MKTVPRDVEMGFKLKGEYINVMMETPLMVMGAHQNVKLKKDFTVQMESALRSFHPNSQ